MMVWEANLYKKLVILAGLDSHLDSTNYCKILEGALIKKRMNYSERIGIFCMKINQFGYCHIK